MLFWIVFFTHHDGARSCKYGESFLAARVNRILVLFWTRRVLIICNKQRRCRPHPLSTSPARNYTVPDAGGIIWNLRCRILSAAPTRNLLQGISRSLLGRLPLAIFGQGQPGHHSSISHRSHEINECGSNNFSRKPWRQWSLGIPTCRWKDSKTGIQQRLNVYNRSANRAVT